MTDVEPIRNSDHSGWIDKGPRNIERDRQNPDILVPPTTDHGTLPNMRFSFSDAHQRLEEGGWTREVTNRELPASHDLAGVDMCLKPGAYRELHWHKEAEWAFMIAGNARVTALDEQGRSFIDDIQAGDLWDFEAGLPHSIQALDQGCEFLLVFSEPDFSENNTFLLTDWLAHTPKDVVAANFKTTQDALTSLLGKEKYIFSGDVPGSLESVKRPNKNGDMPVPLTLHMASVKPKQFEAGKVWIIDSTVFPAAQTISAAIVEVQPGGMRELHWHPKSEEWDYYVQGQAKVGVFNSAGLARTYNFQAGDVGVIPLVAGHYIQNIGTEPLIFIELFKNPVYSDISLNKWLATNPTQMVADHLNLTPETVASLPQEEAAVIWYDQSKTTTPAEPSTPDDLTTHARDIFK
ncbi:oxalate decarboxylase [Secundilactobacillus paracollinoides]|uniref:oxalate decarboxylase family bicupin n=1 Tax=Secundilactobacillus paracollinoides TaxID=240427 RepID=UPI00081A52C5|nr:oxalate decarboxylase family bicupin [Secundilactobacillus paracollinoides]ANZ63709.1 oxalate decarboxylase [Secundilactobacillus paracollinoides]